MKHVLAFAMVVALVVALVLGCTTTRTLPDGTVEVEQLDPQALAAFIELARAAIEVAAATNEAEPDADEPDGDVLADVLEAAALAQAAQLILQDGVTADELESLKEIYAQVEELLARNNVRLKIKTTR